jgi:hypothetical protein
MNLEKELKELNEWKEIIKATCLSCGKETTDKNAIQIMNDLDAVCSDCDEYFVQWETVKGFIITAEIQDYKGNPHSFRNEYAKEQN